MCCSFQTDRKARLEEELGSVEGKDLAVVRDQVKAMYEWQQALGATASKSILQETCVTCTLQHVCISCTLHVCVTCTLHGLHVL